MDLTRQPTSCRWRVAGVSIRGTSHERTGALCQDALSWCILGESVLIAAVADGAGSASLGDLGARVAAQIAVQIIAERSSRFQPALPENDGSWQLLLTKALRLTQKAIYLEALAHEVPPRELATTLILMVATPELVAVAQIGDGASVVADTEGNISGVTAPQIGEYINQTSFLISPDALSTSQFTVWRGKTAHIAIISDGLQMLALKMPEGIPHAPFFSPLFRFMARLNDEVTAKEQLAAFLRSARIRERTDDDLTLLLANLAR